MGVSENEAVCSLLEQDMLLRVDEGRQEFTPLLEYLIGP
jgi:hypothetical protein